MFFCLYLMHSAVQRISALCDHSARDGRLWHFISRKLSRVHGKPNTTRLVPSVVSTLLFISNYLQIPSSHASFLLPPSTFRPSWIFNLRHTVFYNRSKKQPVVNTNKTGVCHLRCLCEIVFQTPKMSLKKKIRVLLQGKMLKLYQISKLKF
jgi:hypothetical protein